MESNFDIDLAIHETTKRVRRLQRMLHYAIFPMQKDYYQRQLEQEMIELRELNNIKTIVDSLKEKIFTRDELAQYDGSGGKPAYVAVEGVVYDVSTEKTWGGGTHFSLYAGKDLTSEFNSCHDKEEILKNLPKVGILQD